MPPGGGQTTARSRRAARRKPPRPAPRPSSTGAAYYVSQGRAVAHVAHQQRAVARARRATRTAAPLSPRTPAQQRAAGRRSLGFQPHLGDLHPAQQRATQRARRAAQRVSPRPMPHVPVLQNPTRHQAQVAHDLIARAINAQTTGRTGTERQRSRDAIIRDIQTDPRLADVKRASSHYARALERRNSIVIARGSQPSQQSVAADLRRIAGGVARMPGVRPLSSKPVTPKLAGSRAQMMEGLKQAAISYGSKDAGGLGLSQRSLNIRAGRAQSRYARATNQYKALAAPKAKVLALGPASLNVTPAVTAATKAIGAALAQTSLNTGDLGPRSLGQKTLNDVRQIATGPFVGLYGLSQGLYDLQSGNSKRLTDLAAGTARGTAETFTHPVRSFQRDPLITALTFAGGVGAVGRVAGALARGAGAYEAGGLTGGARAALAHAGSDIRPPVAYSADAAKAGIRERRYSKDLIRKSIQVAQDARREPLTHPDGSPVTVKYGHREVPVLAPRGTGKLTPEGDATRPGRFSEIERQGRKTGDYLSASQQSAEYHMRDAANRAFALKGIKGQHAKDLVAMVAEGTVRSAKTFEQDLRSYRDMVQGEITRHEAGDKVFRTSKEVREAQAQVARIDRILGDKRVASQIDRIVAAGEDVGKRLNEGEAEAQLHGLMDPTRARRAALIHPAILHMGAKHFTPEETAALAKSGVDVSEEALAHGALRKGNGQFISNRDIENTLREAGRDPRTVAYLPPGTIGRSAFHRRFNISRPTVAGGKHARTGEQYRRGLTRAGETSVREQGVKLAVVTQKGRGVDRVISEHGMLHPTGRYFTGKEAEEYAKRLADETGERLTPVSAFPAKATAEMQKLAKGEQSVDAMENLSQRLLNDRIAPGPNAKNVVLMPSSIVERLQAHAAPTNELVKVGQWINKPFRAAVLPQPRWLAGNVVEPGIRLTMRGSGVNVVNLGLDLTATTRIMRGLKNSSDPAERAMYHHLEGQLGQGLFVGGRGATVRRTLEEMPGHDTWGPMVQRLPIMRTMVEMGRTLGHGVMAPANLFFKANRVIENVANRAEFGRNARRDIQSFTGSWTQTLRLGDKAVAEAKRGLMNTPTQRRFAETAYETLGKYTGFNPTMRALTQTIMPFIPWMLNAARFVFWTLPAHHTVKTALLQQASQSMQKDWQDIHKDTPPGNLRFAIPNGKGGWVDIARYTPWGAFTEAAGGGGGKTFTGQILPQLGGVTGALEGKDPFGRDLSAPPGKTPNPTAIAVNSALEAMVPYAATIRRLREGGATGYSTSTALHPETKPGTKHSSAVARTFSPINPTYLRAPTGGAGGAPADPRAVRRAQRSAARAGGSNASLERALKRARRAAGK